jgi:hypothetical protein
MKKAGPISVAVVDEGLVLSATSLGLGIEEVPMHNRAHRDAEDVNALLAHLPQSQ